MFKKIICITIFCVIACAPSSLKTKSDGAPKIEVIYPGKKQQVNAVDSTFILGNVTPGSKLYINNYRIAVHPEGGFLAFLPLVPVDTGWFVFQLRASNDYGDTTLEWPVKLPEPFKTVPLDSLAILSDFNLPARYQELIAGDLLELSIRGTPLAVAQYKITGLTDWKPMFEISSMIQVPGSETIFGSENLRDSTIGTGVYRAGMFMPSDTALDSADIIFRLCKIVGNSPSDSGLLECVEDTVESILSLKKYDFPQVVELIDSVQTIRHGPRKGYLSIYQPKGVRFIADGKYNNYVRLDLGPGQAAWIPDSSIIYLPEGTPAPYSEVKYIRTFAMDSVTRVSTYLDMMLPYRVEFDPKAGRVGLLVYYVTSDTDWIRYDTDDDLIDYIVWSQPPANVYRLDIQLNENEIWGYDAFYEDNVLNLDLKKAPKEVVNIEDLKFVIDPGHSRDPGSIGPTGLREADANLAISRKLVQLLRDKGAVVAMTRTGNENVELHERPEIAVRENCDIFISVHNNALPDGVNPFENHGTSTYYYHMHSKPLAEHIQRKLVDKLEMGSFGHYHANFAVTRPTQYLSVLVECTFMILPDEEARLRGEEFPKKCAEAI
ncbi:MAG TPA: N-acetylmuramoyl-L-alanine amidase, partial [candidate division Zixibacteria bacterium]|nr:N-acetylmuramoyl-L-alanine amidase [candidate division Zixibacteria bacterium]